MKPLLIRSRIICALLIGGATLNLNAQGSAFTYQGRLNDGANPVNGVYDLRFALFQYDTGGNAVLGPITNVAVTVSNGLFTTLLDFGPYDSSAYGRGNWLEISVRTNGPGSFTVMNPKQQMTPTPRAIYAQYASAPNPGSGFSADTLDGLDSTAFWQLGGNAGTTAGTHFLGTTDNQPLELKVNNARGLRIEPTIVGVNFIAGNANNSIANDSVVSAIGGGQLNIIQSSAFGSTISGGDINTIQFGSPESVIGGGIQNIIGTNAIRSVIAGGLFNRVGSNALYSVISGGRENRITNDSAYATISGGSNNVIGANSAMATIGGGVMNKIGPSAPNGATISGGYSNSIAGDTYQSVIAGGAANFIGQSSDRAVIGGGVFNTILATNSGATIAGGFYHTISNYSSSYGPGYSGYSAIGGGYENFASGFNATIPGGALNEATADYSFAAGNYARAHHEGCFVWSEPLTNIAAQAAVNDLGIESSAKYQFLIRATGGVGIGVNNPQQQLSVATGVNIDQKNLNDGTIVSSLTFGSGSGEGIGSKRSPGGDQFGLDFYSNFAKRMSIINNGNVGIGTDTPSQKLHVIGNILASGTITPNSDRNLKTDIAPVDTAAVLEKVARLPIQQWRFKSEPDDVKHFGPMAQDFRAAFGLGEIPTAIATVDADGVALAAIQALKQKLEQKDVELAELKARMEKLERRLDQRADNSDEPSTDR